MKERQRKFHSTQKNNNARVPTYLWVRSPGRSVPHTDPQPSSIWLGRFREHTGSGLLLDAGDQSSVLHSPFHDNLLVLGIGQWSSGSAAADATDVALKSYPQFCESYPQLFYISSCN